MLMETWGHRLESILAVLKHAALDQARLESIWDLHCEYENIHPWVDGNGRSGRILMVNHSILVGLEPEIIHYGPEQQAYYRRIEAHPSHQWGQR